MLSGPVLKQFRTYLKSQVGNGWSVEGRKSKGRLLTRVSFRYLSGERSVVLLDIDFDAENQDDIVRTVKKLSDLMRERNIELSKAKELLCGGKIDAHGKAFINWKSLQDEFINVERGGRVCKNLFLEKEISRKKDISKGGRPPWKYGPKTFPTCVM